MIRCGEVKKNPANQFHYIQDFDWIEINGLLILIFEFEFIAKVQFSGVDLTPTLNTKLTSLTAIEITFDLVFFITSNPI